MRYRIFAVALAALLMLTGCGNESTAVGVIGGADGPTTAVVAGQVEAWEYELYIEEIDYSMEKYSQGYYSARNAFAFQDEEAAKEHLESAIEALSELEKAVCPPDLEEVHSKFLYTVGLAKELAECNMKRADYMAKSDVLTPEDQRGLEALAAEIDGIYEKFDESGSIGTAWSNVQSAAFSRLPNGEYKIYSARLEVLWEAYVWDGDLIAAVFFDGASADLLSLSGGCLSVLSSIENMDVPEQMKPYHNDISEAIPMERDFCQAISGITESYREYPELKFEDMPADAQKKIQECQETIEAYYSEDNSEWDALYNAVCAALDFADAQAGQ